MSKLILSKQLFFVYPKENIKAVVQRKNSKILWIVTNFETCPPWQLKWLEILPVDNSMGHVDYEENLALSARWHQTKDVK